MAVNLSPLGGAGAQFFTNDGVPLTGGLLYTYLAGTSTPATTYTSSSGITALANPIILDSAGRVPTGEIWLTDGVNYKFVLKDATDALIATWDGLSGINSNFISYTSQQEVQTATAGQTVFTTTLTYIVGTDNLAVFVNGSKQIATVNYIETNANTVTFLTGLNVGDLVQFSTASPVSAGSTLSSNVQYTPAGTGAVATTVQAKLRESVSVKDFGAKGDGVTDDTTAINAAITFASNHILYFPKGDYKISSTINFGLMTSIVGEGPQASRIIASHSGVAVQINVPVTTPNLGDTYSQIYENFGIVGNINTTFGFFMMRCIYCSFKNIWVTSPQGISSGYAGFRVSGAMYLNTYENCVANTTTNTQATVGSAWWIGNGLNEVANSNGLTNDNTFITCRGSNYANGYDVDYSSGNVFLNCDAEVCSTATFHVRCNYSKFIAPWQEVGTMVFDQYTPTNGSGGTTAAQSPAYNEVTCTLPFSITLNYSTFATLHSGRLNNVTIGANANNTRTWAIEIGGTFTNSGSDGNLQYSTGGNQYHSIQIGTNTEYSKLVTNGSTTITMNDSQSLQSNRFGNLILNSGSHVTEIAGTTPMFLINKTTAPGSSPANTGYLYVQDNGSGKMQLCAKFPSGVAQVIATQP